MWQRRSTQWLLIVSVWALPGLYFAIQVYLQRAFENKPISLAQALLRGLVFWLLWVVSSPLILRLARTYPIPRREWVDGILFHLPAGFIFSLVHLLIFVFITSWIERGSPLESLSGLLVEFQPVFISSFAWWSLVYWTILIACYALDYYRRFQEGVLRSSRLEAQLAQSELQALKMQLHPHFLFNTLHSISALMRDEPDLAEQMIARLGDFLRMTLQYSGEHETTLRRELDFLQCYLDIEKIRFQDRLKTVIDVAPELMEARVPHLILQPIVENAIRHGIAPMKTQGMISIRASRDNGHLKIEVLDNGPGLKNDPRGVSVRGENGVGLANTRSRLRQFYGDDHLFIVENATEGGLSAILEIPAYETARAEI